MTISGEVLTAKCTYTSGEEVSPAEENQLSEESLETARPSSLSRACQER